MDFHAIYRVLVTNTSFYFNGCIHNIIPLQKLLLLEGTEASFLLFSNKKYIFKLFQYALYII